MENMITQHMDIWTTAQIKKNGAGRGNGSTNQSLYGIKKLRGLILELALHGKLTTRNTNDEPANELLKKINDSLCHENNIKSLPKLKRDKSTTEPQEFHYDIPQNWIWCELQDVSIFTNGKAHEQYITKEPQYILINSRFVSTSGEIKKYATERLTPLKKGDIAIVMSDVPDGRALVRCYLVESNEKYTLNQRIGCITSAKEMNKEYLMLVLDRNKYYLQYDDGKKQTNLKKIQIMSCPIPLPPLAEQHRIVAKVDELMAFCDQLEQKQTDSNALHQTLVETMLSTLISAANAFEFSQAWQRIACHFDVLFTTEQSIDQLKQTILQLAVMGKLVPQDPNDEPASVLLKRIAAEKARLVKDGKLKKQDLLREISEEEKPFEQPESWAWIILGSAGIGSTGKTPGTSNPKYYNGEIPFIGPGQISTEGDITESDKTLTMEGCEYSTIAEPGDILMVCIGGSIGKSAIVRSKIAFNQQINCIRPLIVDSIFLNITMKAPHFQTSILNAATGSATPIINRSKWEDLLVTLPPLAEQHRIVAKVDELMALCDKLKARINDAKTTQVQLANAIVEQAVS